MKNNILFIISFLCLHFGAISQNGYSISPESFDETYNEDLDEVIYLTMEALMENSSDATLAINWEIVNVDLPLEWGLSVSDKDMSYPPVPEIITTNAHPITLNPGDVDIPFNVHIYPNDISGCGFFDVLITSDESGIILDTIEYEVSINHDDCLINAVNNYDVNEQVELFPNPFADHIAINTEFTIRYIKIYSLRGDVLTTALTNFQNLNVSNLESGIYLMEIGFNKGRKVIKKIIKEH